MLDSLRWLCIVVGFFDVIVRLLLDILAVHIGQQYSIPNLRVCQFSRLDAILCDVSCLIMGLLLGFVRRWDRFF